MADFARQQGGMRRTGVVLARDRAGWHRATRLVLPAGAHPWWLPAYTPRLNPAERLWTLVRDASAHIIVGSLPHLDATLAERRVTPHHDPLPVARLINYHWWP